jgi:ankyrin repeat protein
VLCQLKALQKCLPQRVRQFLKELPASLDETYKRILKEIRKPKQAQAHRLLQCLVAAARPLRVEELAEVLAFDFNAEGIPELNPDWRWEDQKKAVVSACSSLVSIAEAENGKSEIVQFSHFSVKEFLTADRLRLAEPDRGVSCYYIGLDDAHTVLVRACLGVLLCLDDGVDEDNIENVPLAQYSAQYWTTHAQFKDVSLRTKDGMERLFDADRPHFATWLWIYNDDQDGRSISTMHPEKPEATPLYYAASFGFLDLVKHLIAKHPEDVTAKGGKAVTAMHVAAREGYTDILLLLLDHGAAVDGRGLSGQTPLHRAAWSGRVDAGQCLLDYGADINAQSDDKGTPLFLAAIHGHVDFIRILLERRAAIDVRNVAGQSPLQWAVQGGRIEAVRLLLEHGADANARNVFDETPSHVASGPRRQEIVELLSEYGAEFVESASLMESESSYFEYEELCAEIDSSL